jgi:hypothetical protein
MRLVPLCLFVVACGGSSAGPAQLSVGGTYPTTVALVPGGTCNSPQVSDNTTVVAHSPGSASLTLTHAGSSYAGTITPAGAFTVPATAIGGGAFTVSMTGQFSATGFTATVHVVQQQPSCQYDVNWTGTKSGPSNPYP